MELFTINRYLDGSENTTKSSNADQENELLQRLLQKAEKRKRLLEKKAKAAADAAAQEQGAEENNEVPELTSIESQGQAEENELDTEAVEQETRSADFQVLGDDAGAAKRQKVEMVLPAWLAHPTIIAGDKLQADIEATTISDDEASIKQQTYLADYTRRALEQMKIKRLFPVQRAVIPWVLAAHAKPAPYRPRDICVSAPTGSGKTLAFAIPIVQSLNNRVERKVRALIVLPVAELALQVYKVINALCNQTELEVCLLSKQQRLKDEQQRLVEEYKGVYYSKVDIVVTTPGRLVEHLHVTKGFCLKALKFLVIDEADRIMDAVFQNWLYHLDTHVRATTDQLLVGRTSLLCYADLVSSFGKYPHKLLFSATLSQDPEKLANLHLFQPKLFTTVMMPLTPLAINGTDIAADSLPVEESSKFIGKYTTPAELTEQYCLTELRLKPLTLFTLMQEQGWKRFLCFCNSADTSTRLTFVLSKLFKNDLQITELSAALTAKERQSRLKSFTNGKINGLICSDALARGIDVANVDLVISYDVPRHIKTYIHRVGRTARAGRPGTAITLLTEQEQPQFQKMLADVDKPLTQEITVSTDMETQHAHEYQQALSKLHDYLDAQKSVKMVAKKRTARKAELHKNAQAQGELTLMQKLQLNAGVSLVTPAKAAKQEQKPKHVKPQRQKINVKKRSAIEE